MASSQFARPGKGAGPHGKGAGSYPMPDAAHARAAIGLYAMHHGGRVAPDIRKKADSVLRHSDGGKGAQPQFRGAAKDTHRGQEHAYDERHSMSKTGGGVPNVNMASAKVPPVGEVPSGGQKSGGNRNMGGAKSHHGISHDAGHGGNGLIKAMHAHADKMHPC